MDKPYIICHMMTAVDGRIDCAMTEKLAGVKEYYSTLNALQATATLSGRVTAQLEMAQPGSFQSRDNAELGETGFSKAVAAEHYEIVVDTKGSLLWDKRNETNPLIVITCERVSKEYLAYLDAQKISWIACGKERIDLAGAMAILRREFGVERLAVVGGGTINAGFLDAGLLDEVSILLAPGIDGRKGMTAAFDGLPMEREPFALQLAHVASYDDGAVWLRYLVKHN